MDLKRIIQKKWILGLQNGVILSEMVKLSRNIKIFYCTLIIQFDLYLFGAVIFVIFFFVFGAWTLVHVKIISFVC